MANPYQSSEGRPPAPAAGPTGASAPSQTKAVWPFVVIAALALPIGLAIYEFFGFEVGWRLHHFLHIPWQITAYLIPVVVFLVMLIGGIIGAIIRAGASSKTRRVIGAAAPAGPIGWTNDGQPVYPVVGYTADGKPVTADKMVGIPPPYPGPNPSDRVR